MATATTHVCDTIPAARLADPDHTMSLSYDPDTVFNDPDAFNNPKSHQEPPPRKLCVRHQRMADEGTNVKLQQSLDALPLEEREAVNAIWSNFSSSSHPRRALILQGLLTMCCFSQLSLISEQLSRLIRIDPFTVLPREICLKILSYLDGTSLCRAAQVSKPWNALADDNVLWRSICEQHIGHRCPKCGVCLPLLDKRKVVAYRKSTSPVPIPSSLSPSQASLSSSLKRRGDCDALSPPLKRHRSDEGSNSSIRPRPSSMRSVSAHSDDLSSSSSSTLLSTDDDEPPSMTRPWKVVYGERAAVELNWRRGRCTTRTLKGHTDGVMCLQFSETLPHPSFPVLISGSYDRTARVWNMETGEQLRCLRGHTLPVRALQFDEVHLITGSMDCTLKVWDWRRGTCIRTLTGHTEGVVCLNYDSNVLASGSVDMTIRVWNIRTGGSFTLRGHSDWVNAVQLWDSDPTSMRATTTPTMESHPSKPALGSNPTSCYRIDPGKMLFSASDDGTIRLWDLNARSCIQQFVGHMGQVQGMKLLFAEEDENDMEENKLPLLFPLPLLSSSSPSSSSSSSSSSASSSSSDSTPEPGGENMLVPHRTKPVLVSGSLDNTVKLWDIETGKTLRTYFGHIEGVWTVACDRMRLVSGSHDRTIKVWSRDSEKCVTTLIAHQAAVSCLALAEDKIVSGSDDKTIKIWSFSD